MFNSKVIEQFTKFNKAGKPFTVWNLVTAAGQSWSGGSDGAAHQVIRMIQQGYGPAAGCLTMVVVPPAEIANKVKATRYNKWPEDNGSLLAIFSQEYLNAAYSTFLGGSDDGDDNFAGYLHDRLVGDLWPSHVKTVGQVAQELTTPATAQPIQEPQATEPTEQSAPEATEKETIITFTSVAKAAEWITAECRKLGDDQRFTINARIGVYSGYLSEFQPAASVSKAAVEKALKAKLA